MTIRTRFAPSPTGYLHIGGVRTALFNWLLVQRHGGQFILRIDDTDAERNRAEALQPILDGFKWLGLTWDEGPEVGGPYGPYFQSQRNHLYAAAAMKLLESGHAYPDYSTKEETDAAREAAQAAKKPFVFRGANRDAPAAENVRAYRDNPAPLRFKVPLGRTIVVDDLICGKCEQAADLVGDPVILRAPDADGAARALYNFASVVDDAALKITHVVRAREHLANTYPQVLFFEALGYELPKFGHIPVVNEPAPKPGATYRPGVKPPNKNKKLSKRDMAKFVTPDVREKLRMVGFSDADIDGRDDLNPATVAFYRELGYLPEGLINYLGRLGWSFDDKTEFMTLDFMKANFDLGKVNESAASFDPDKLYWLAGEHMMRLPVADKVAGCLPFLVRAGLLPATASAAELAKLTRVVEAAGERLKLFSDVLPYGAPFFRPEPVYDAKAVEKAFKKANARDNLAAFAARLAEVEPSDAASVEAAAHAFCAERGIKFGDVQLPIRVAVTGTDKGVGLFETLEIVGRDESVRRIGLAVAAAAG